MSKKELQAELLHKAMSVKDLHEAAKAEDRGLTDEERVKADELTARCDSIETEIETMEADEKRSKEADERLAELQKPEERQIPAADPGKSPEKREDAKPDIEFRQIGRIRSFKGDDAARKAFEIGMWLRSKFSHPSSDVATHANRWLRDNSIYTRATHVTTNNSLGGALVPVEMSNAIINLREDYGVFRQEARVISMSSDTLDIPVRATGVSAAWGAEAAAITESNMTWSNVMLVAKKLGILNKVSNELNEDSMINVVDWLVDEIALEFANEEDKAGFIGDGTSTYGGIVGLKGALAAGSIYDMAVGTDLTSEITVAQLSGVMSKLPQYAMANAKWYCSLSTFEQVFGRLTAAGGGNTIQTLAGPVQRTYLGVPIVISQVLPADTGTLAEEYVMYYGDLNKAAIMGDRGAISVMSSDQRYFESDQLGIRATERVDIKVHSAGTASAAGAIIGVTMGAAS
jgi:HK97 family phage major capsid protein